MIGHNVKDIINLDGQKIGQGKVFVIAEIGNNHNGSFDRAVEMIDKAVAIGVDCVKFQMRNLEDVYRSKSLEKRGEDLGTEYVLDLLKKFELSTEEHKALREYCKELDVVYLCTPWDLKSVELLETFGVSGYKVASADLTNMPLLTRLSDTKKPLIISTGMSLQSEMEFTINFLKERDVEFVLLHCNSTYPAPLYDINLNFISSLLKLHRFVGYSGHERGINVSLAAVALGGCVVERHFSLDREMEGPDHAASLTECEFVRLVGGIREIEEALGDSSDRKLSQGEMINRENLGKSLISSKSLKKGTLIKPNHIKVQSPGQGLSPQHYSKLVGRTLSRDLNFEDYFYPSDLTENRLEPREYIFKRPWGIPVRYHDFKKYNKLITPDLWEFHLSYSDLQLSPKNYLNEIYQEDFVVHAPELFSDSHLLDLASENKSYRQRSIDEMQRVIDLTNTLKEIFPKTKKPLIVTNVGGWSIDQPLTKDEITASYERFFISLDTLDTSGIEVLPQSMAPFPWHFGGQRYQNIFIKSDDIIKYCLDFDIRICYDVSHSRLACNLYDIDFYEFSKAVTKFTAHLHIGDALKLNGEGLQVGQGDIDFSRLSAILNKGCPCSSFIPEIWQGHKNDGEGFWVALEKLEGLL